MHVKNTTEEVAVLNLDLMTTVWMQFINWSHSFIFLFVALATVFSFLRDFSTLRFALVRIQN